MSSQGEQQAKKFATKKLAIGTRREKIITQLCEDYAMNWEGAEAFLLDFEIRQGPKLRSNRSLIVIMGLGAVLVGSLLVAVYIVGTIVSRSTVSQQWAVFAFITGISLFLLALIIYSRNENSTKERYRCSQCGFLVNRLGQEKTVFFPRYESSTYHTHKKLLSTRTIGDTSSREAWDIYAKFELTEMCRQCRQVRSIRIVEERVVGYSPNINQP